MDYIPTIGLEIHAELRTKTKMFCDSLNDPNERHPNVNVCPVCMGHPGTLPVINEEAVKKVLKTGLALNCEIPETSKFDRKNYFYPDLPKGYQISQYDMPLCKNGYLEIDGKKIRIRRIHLEEDTGRLIHPERMDYSLVDFNRAGIPLMELVTEPDIKSGEDSRKFAEELQLIFRYLGVSDADMEKGQMRVEVNLSLSNKEGELGTKVEVKNLNSFRAVEKAVEYEMQRQGELLDAGEKIIQETRGWDDQKQITISQRIKEEAHDYRYFPEPDLPIIKIKNSPYGRSPVGRQKSPAKAGSRNGGTNQKSKIIEDNNEIELNEIRAGIPELPQQRRERFAKEYGLLPKDVGVLVQDKELGDYFEKIISELQNWIKDKKIPEEKSPDVFKLCANYLITDLQSLLKKAAMNAKELLITPEDFAEFIILIFDGKITSKAAKEVLPEMFGKGLEPHHIIEERGLEQINDEKEILNSILDIIRENPGPADDYKSGKAQALQFLVGKAMAKTKGKANPQIVQDILKKELNS